MREYYDFEEYEEYYRSRNLHFDRAILHSDLNNFFASVESLSEPFLKDIPLAVCGDSELRHGVVLAKNEVAKRFGIRTGDTVGNAKRKCPELVIRSTHYSDYVKYSRRVREIYLEYATRVEPFGIDEAWIDISELVKLKGGEFFKTAREIADEIRKRVKSEIGLTVSIGVSFNKTFAKLASDMKKPDAVTVIPYNGFREMIKNISPSNLLFVGKQTSQALDRLKIRTIGELARHKRIFIKSELGKSGEDLWDRSNGYDISPVSLYHNAQSTKSISNSTTVPRDIVTYEEAFSVLNPLCDAVAQQLRERCERAAVFKIYVKFSDFSSIVRQMKIPPSDSTNVFFTKATELLRKNCKPPFSIRSIGVGVEDFVGVDAVTRDMFYQSNKLDFLLDLLKVKYGDDIITTAGIMKNKDVITFDKRHVAFSCINI